jgi:hypothetical protein
MEAAVGAQGPGGVVDRVALGEAAEVDAQAGPGEADGARATVERQKAPADRAAGPGQRLGAGRMPAR